MILVLAVMSNEADTSPQIVAVPMEEGHCRTDSTLTVGAADSGMGTLSALDHPRSTRAGD